MHNDENKFGDDSFWDIKSEKTNKEPQKKPSASVKISISIDSDKAEAKKSTSESYEYTSGTITRYVSSAPKKPNTDRRLISEYEPPNPLIKKVQIYTDNDSDSVFAKDNLFLRERRALIDRTFRETPYVPFYSLSPRYSQMTRSQLGYYLWWRENVRKGIWLQSSPSYVYLYIHELICGEDEDKNEILSKLCELYCMQVSDSMSYSVGPESIICDYCIINNLSLPAEMLGDKLQRFLCSANVPEFFTDISDRENPSLHKKVIASSSVYNYKKSKHYIGNENLFDTHMLGAVAYIFKTDRSYAALSAFTNAGGNVFSSYKPFFKISGITTKNAKIKIDYYPLTFLQAPITDALRYTENKIREHLGIKSKLNVTTLNPDIRSAIDEYALLCCPPMSKHQKMLAEERLKEEEYDRLYDVPKSPLSIENAKEIEEESWQTTQILVEAFAEEGFERADEMQSLEASQQIPTTDIVSAPTKVSKDGSLIESFCEVLNEAFEFLDACIKQDLSAQRKYCSVHSVTTDEIAEQINEAALQIVGDIILEECDGYYKILDDYTDLFS